LRLERDYFPPAPPPTCIVNGPMPWVKLLRKGWDQKVFLSFFLVEKLSNPRHEGSPATAVLLVVRLPLDSQISWYTSQL